MCYFATFVFETFKVLVIYHFSCYIVINEVKLAVMCLISLTYKLQIKSVFFTSRLTSLFKSYHDSYWRTVCVLMGGHYVHIPVAYTNVRYCSCVLMINKPLCSLYIYTHGMKNWSLFLNCRLLTYIFNVSVIFLCLGN